MRSIRPRLPLEWELTRVADAGAGGETRWVPASVPGAVQLDWGRAHGWAEFWQGDNVRREWADLDESPWIYRTRLPAEVGADAAAVGGDWFLVLEGIDYTAEVWVAGELRTTHVGAQGRVEINLGEAPAPGAEVEVRLAPAPKSRPEPKDRVQANRSCKAAVGYGWDFHPRLVPLGLWAPAYLERRGRRHLAGRPVLDYRLNDECTAAEGMLAVTLAVAAAKGDRVRWRLMSPDGGCALAAEVELAAGARGVTLPFHLEAVTPWWPHDQGAPALYRAEVELVAADGRVVDARVWRTGFRRVRLVMAPEQWKEPSAFPKSRSHPPITLEVNGRALFVKGANWVCPDVFPGTVSRERYAEQLALARGANLSLLRIWGGALAPHDAFFELCDELGVMVWQEFPLACNAYPDDDAYLAELDCESRALIARLREHPALVLWCGGNELFNFWSGMTDQSHALRLLNRNCFDLDRTRPFLPTAPVDGMGHGHYVFRDPMTGAEAWALFQDARCTAYTEFGSPAPASAATLRRILPENDIWPPRAGTSWETHHAFGAWMTSSHLYREEIEYYFGPAATLEELVERGQLLQSEGYRGIYEEVRRQKPAASMALCWCLNEPWPTAANNSLISWPCEPKPALRAVAEACRPVLASARIRKFAWRSGERFELELWMLNDSPGALVGTRVSATLELDGRRIEIGAWAAPGAPANTNVRGPSLACELPDFSGPRFSILLTVDGRAEWSSRYTLVRARDHTGETHAAVQIRAGAMNF